MPPLNSLIVGPGAIGALTCADISGYGNSWVHPHRPNIQLAKILNTATQPITLDWQLQHEHDPAQPIDVIWVCCKAQHVMQTLPALMKQHSQAQAILLHNGMGPQEALSQQFESRVIWGSTTCGALATSATEYTQTSFGHTDLAQPTNSAQASLLSQLTEKSDRDRPLKLSVNKNIAFTLWRKLLINACINPLTAALQIRNGQLLSAEHHDDIKKIIDEINNIMAAKNLPLVQDAFDTVMQVCEFSAQNFSSMAVDVQQNRGSEIDYINGYLIDQAQALNLPTPTLKKWYKRIASLSES